MPVYSEDQFPPEFIERVQKAHTPVRLGERSFEPPGFSSGAVEAMTPEQHKMVLHHAAMIQRDNPESVMLDVQRTAGGGIYSYLAEHVGDLTHRLNESGGLFGTEYVAPKVRTALNTLEHGYGVEREHNEQMVSNKTDLEALAAVGKRYADAHRLVPVYNKPSMHARSAAVAIGEGDFDHAKMALWALRRTMADPDHFRHLMSQQGSVEYLRNVEQRGY